MADLVGSKKITDVSDIRDESDSDGMRIVVEVSATASPHTVMQQLFKHTALQTSFSANMLALVDGQPQTLGLKRMLEHYITYRREVVRRRTEFDLARAQERAHILEGLKVALDNLDEVIATIRAAADVEAARAGLMKRFKLTEVQANAILEMQLRRLAALERKKIEDEYKAIIKLIGELEDLLANRARSCRSSRTSWPTSRSATATTARPASRPTRTASSPRRTSSPSEDVVVTLSQRGYIKRQPIGTFRSQRRGGRGKLAMITREEDAVRHLLVANTHDNILFFTNRGRVFITKVHTLPDASRQAKGLPIINLPGVQVDQREYVSAIISLPQFEPDHYLVMATRLRQDQEDLAGRLRQDPRQRPHRDQPPGRRRAPVGRPVRRPEATSSWPPRRARRRASARPRSGRWAATRMGVTAVRLKKDDEVVGMEVVQNLEDAAPGRDRAGLRQAHRGRWTSRSSIAPPAASSPTRSTRTPATSPRSASSDATRRS